MTREHQTLLGMLISKCNPANLQATTLAHLSESGLVLQNLLGLLEAVDLSLTAGSSFLVGLRLGNAAVLDLAVVLHDCGKLLGGSGLVGGEFCDFSIKSLEFL